MSSNKVDPQEYNLSESLEQQFQESISMLKIDQVFSSVESSNQEHINFEVCVHFFHYVTT